MTTTVPSSSSSAGASGAAQQSSRSGVTPSSKRRPNDLLRNYYGLGEVSASSSAAAAAAAKADRSRSSDIDGDDFDADAALQTYLQTKSLAELLRAESTLLTEIRELDGEKQSLVYNHHHELVTASETIGRMRDRADALTPSLTALQASLKEITHALQDLQVPSELVEENSVSMTDIQQGGTPLSASDVRKIVSPAVELPTRLRDTIILEGVSTGLEKARGIWGSMEAVLAAWDEAGIPGAKDIMNECRSVLREAQQQQTKQEQPR